MTTLLLLALAASPSFKNAVGFDHAPAAARSSLTRDGFAVVEGDEPHFFSLYDKNAYQKLPSFITVDVVLHVFHSRFDQQLADTELKVALPALTRFARLQMTRALSLSSSADSPLRRLAIFHGVALALLTGQTSVDPRIDKDVQRWVKKATGDAVPANATSMEEFGAARLDRLICGQPVEFSLFKPRGHYERADLQPYFRGAMWYSQCAFDLKHDLSHALDLVRLVDAPALAELQKVVSLRTLVAGPADDPGVEAMRALGELPDPSVGLDAAALDAIAAKLKSLPAAKVPSLPVTDARVFRLLGQSATADSGALNLLHPSALQLFSAMDKPEWNSGAGLTGDWLEVLRTVVHPPVQQPPFEQSDAWRKHTQVSAAGSWAELRHDTILYAKQPMVMKEGGHQEELPPQSVGGYVDPRPDVYRRLGELSAKLSAATGVKEDALQDFIAFLISTSELELSGKPFPKAVDERLRTVGSELEALSRTKGDRQPPEPVIADIATVRDPETKTDEIFHIAVGAVDEVWAVVPRAGAQVLMRGGAFSFYEFGYGSRLNDSEWLELLPRQTRPDWAKPIVIPKKPRTRD